MQFTKLVLIMVSGFAFNFSAACIYPQIGQPDFTAIGVVKNTDGEVVYEEHHNHQADLDGGKSKVDYKTPDGKVIAEKFVEYDCRFSAPTHFLNPV